MTKQETYRILATLQAIYPDSFRGMTEAAAQLKVELWHKILADEAVEVVEAAVIAYISTDKKGFMPVPGQIKEQISFIISPDSEAEQEAWGQVVNALRNSTYNSVSEFEKLPEDIKRAVGSANMLKEWAAVGSDVLQTVIASNFKKEYRNIVSQRKDFNKIPNAVKQLLEGEQKQLEQPKEEKK